MSPSPAAKSERISLTRERVFLTAVALADRSGISAITMRSLAEAVGVKPMSLYHHVANKEQLLDGVVDAVFAEITLPVPTGNWRAELGRRASSVREVLGRHPWAIGLLESRTSPGPATLLHHNAVLASLREAGFSLVMAAHAYALLDSYVYGFALQEATLALPAGAGEATVEAARAFLEYMPPSEYPYLFEMATQHVMQPGYSFGDEFDFGLNVVLDAIANLQGNSAKLQGNSAKLQRNKKRKR
jgi:AcrR family transcriptional regulator